MNNSIPFLNPFAVVDSRVNTAIERFYTETGIKPNAILMGQTDLAVIIAQRRDDPSVLFVEGPRVSYRGLVVLPSGEPGGVKAALLCEEDLPKREA